MTSVKGRGGDDPHVAVLLGKVLLEIRAAFAGEDWGGLRQSHFRLLSQVPPSGISVTDLAVLLGMTKQAVGQFVTFLVESGHLEVRDSPADRRVRLVVRTRLGDDTNRAVTARIRRIERQWARRVGPERYAAFRDVLETLAPRGQG
jgi:DNA-binding MarR family transcriptional regulator